MFLYKFLILRFWTLNLLQLFYLNFLLFQHEEIEEENINFNEIKEEEIKREENNSKEEEKMNEEEIKLNSKLNDMNEAPSLESNKIYYNCSECSSTIEILSLSKDNIEFKCNNNHKIKIQKKSKKKKKKKMTLKKKRRR